MAYETMSDEEYERELAARGDSDRDADKVAQQLYEQQKAGR